MSGPRGRTGPPRRLERWLGACIPEGAAGRDGVLGDLHEEYVDLRRRRGAPTANLWYALQVVALGTPWRMASILESARMGLSGLMLDLRASLRGLRRRPALVAVSVLSLSFGTGLVSAAATLVNGAWYAPLPWASADRMVHIGDTHPVQLPAGVTPGTSARAWERWRTDLPAGLFQRLEAGERVWVPVQFGSGTTPTLRAERVSGGYAELFGFRTRIGRLISPADLLPGAEPVVVLSEAVWRGAYGESEAVLGSTLRVEGVPHTVVGVLRGDVRAPFEAEILLPLPPAAPDGGFQERGVQVIGVLARGVSVDAADQAVSALASAMYARDEGLEAGWSARAVPLRTLLARRGIEPMGALVLVLLCGIVLCVAALNLAALLLARTTRRARELGIRAALGAGSTRIARAALMDGLLLSTAGGLMGLAVVVVGRDAARARFAAEIPSWASFPIDFRVLAATLAGVTATALVVSLLPILRALAIGGRAGVTQASSGPGDRGTSRAQNLLLGGQIVLALVLVSASYGAWTSFARASDFDRLGYRWEGLTGVMIAVNDAAPDATARAAERLASAALADPRIVDAVVTRSLPVTGGDRPGGEGTTVRAGGAAEPLAGPVVPLALAVGPGYFGLNEIDLVAGRPITATDGAGAAPAMVVSVDAVAALWPGRTPAAVLGETVELARGGEASVFTVVGVSAPVIQDPAAGGGSGDARLYPSILQMGEALYGGGTPEIQLRVATGGAPLTREEWEAWVRTTLPGAGVSRVFRVEELLRQRVEPIRVVGAILAGLTLLVLALVAIGIYGTVSYRIASIRHEIGIRLALGADAAQVVRAVLAPLARVVAIAVAAGSTLALATLPVLAAGGLPVEAAGRLPLIAVSLATVAATALAAWWGPLRQALRTDPSVSLRAE